MKRRSRIITGTITVFSMFSANVEAKTENAEQKVKNNKSRTEKAKKEAAVKHKKHKTGNANVGIYRIPSNNSSPLLETKMTELQSLHSKMLTKGSKFEKNRAAIQRKLLSSYSRWLGTPYAWGGDSKGGIDCSALTRRIYRETFGIELPRTSGEQIQQGRRVGIGNLRPGDIVFFKTNRTVNHTAVYVGNSLFINASSSKGVVMSSLESPYWRKYFKYGVRVNGMNT